MQRCKIDGNSSENGERLDGVLWCGASGAHPPTPTGLLVLTSEADEWKRRGMFRLKLLMLQPLARRLVPALPTPQFRLPFCHCSVRFHLLLPVQQLQVAGPGDKSRFARTAPIARKASPVLRPVVGPTADFDRVVTWLAGPPASDGR